MMAAKKSVVSPKNCATPAIDVHLINIRDNSPKTFPQKKKKNPFFDFLKRSMLPINIAVDAIKKDNVYMPADSKLSFFTNSFSISETSFGMLDLLTKAKITVNIKRSKCAINKWLKYFFNFTLPPF